MDKTNTQYVVQTEEFEGPLDLLLNLIEDEELDVTRVSLARVTDQFLQHIEALEEHDPENIVDFLMVASQLMVIKSKALLPLLILEEEEELDARELEFRLKQLKTYRAYAEKLDRLLKKKVMLHERRFVLRGKAQFLPPEGMTKDDFSATLHRLLDELPSEEFLEEETIPDTISTKEKMQLIKRNIDRMTNMKFNQLITDRSSRTEVVITFLALLELLKQRFIEVEQDELFGEITLGAREMS